MKFGFRKGHSSLIHPVMAAGYRLPADLIKFLAVNGLDCCARCSCRNVLCQLVVHYDDLVMSVFLCKGCAEDMRGHPFRGS